MSEFDYPEELKKSTLVTEEGLRFLAGLEGVNPAWICVMAPRWAQSAPKSEKAKSALVRDDLILRSDGSAVCLDGAMAVNSMSLATRHMQGETNPSNLSWDEWTASVTELSEPLE